MLNKIIIGALVLLWSSESEAQLTLGGQGSASFYRYGRTSSPLSENGGRPSFGWDMFLFLDGRVAEHVVAFGTLEAGEASQLDVSVAALRVTDVLPLGLTAQAGKFDLPFGNLGEGRYPRNNPLFDMPLIHRYKT